MPLAMIAVGLLLLAIGLYVQAPMGPAAIWNGILDSTQTSPSEIHGVFGAGTPTASVAMYFRNAPGSHLMLLPPAFAGAAASIQPGDTLRIVLGWGMRQEYPMALGIVQNGAVLLDSSVVLRGQRQRSLRTVLGGALIGLLGLVGVMRAKPGRPGAADAPIS